MKSTKTVGHRIFHSLKSLKRVTRLTLRMKSGLAVSIWTETGTPALRLSKGVLYVPT